MFGQCLERLFCGLAFIFDLIEVIWMLGCVVVDDLLFCRSGLVLTVCKDGQALRRRQVGS